MTFVVQLLIRSQDLFLEFIQRKQGEISTRNVAWPFSDVFRYPIQRMGNDFLGSAVWFWSALICFDLFGYGWGEGGLDGFAFSEAEYL
jgi:hypothetical protein